MSRPVPSRQAAAPVIGQERLQAKPLAEKLHWRDFLSYGIGQCGEGIMGRSLDTSLVFYYSQVLGLPATLVGFLALIGLCLGAALDIVVGPLSDCWRSPIGRRHPFMYAAVIPFGASFFLVFSAAHFTNHSTILFWLVSTLLLARVSLSMYHVPHMAQGAELSDDPTERTRLAASRSCCSILATFLINIIGFGYIFRSTPGYTDGQRNPNAYFSYAITSGILITFAISISAIATHRKIGRLHGALSAAERPSIRTVLAAALEVIRLRSYCLMLSETICYFIAAGLFGSATLYLYTYLWLLKSHDILLVGLAQPIGLLSGFVIIGVLVRRFEKTGVMMIAIGIFALLQTGPLALKLLGSAPAGGTWQLLYILMLAQGAIGIASLQRISVGASLIADIADEVEYMTCRRPEGLIFAGISICETVSGGLGTLVFGLTIDLVGFPRHAIPGNIASATMSRLIILLCLELLLLCGLAIVSLSRIGLTHEYHRGLAGQLRKRRGYRVRLV